jgi:hypothetical protein
MLGRIPSLSVQASSIPPRSPQTSTPLLPGIQDRCVSRVYTDWARIRIAAVSRGPHVSTGLSDPCVGA